MATEKKSKKLTAAEKTMKAIPKKQSAESHNKALETIIATKKSEAEVISRIAEVKPEIFVQYQNQEADMEKLTEKVRRDYIGAGYKASSIKTIKVYVKPEDNAAYYVINDKITGRVNLF